MLARKAKLASLSLCVLGLLNVAATCSHKVRNTEVCTVAGVLSAGMDCAETQADKTRSMNLDETIEFLEPQIADPKTGRKERAGAMCFSSDHFNTNKTDLEILCAKLGKACSLEVKQAIRKGSARMDALQSRTIKKTRIKP